MSEIIAIGGQLVNFEKLLVAITNEKTGVLTLVFDSGQRVEIGFGETISEVIEQFMSDYYGQQSEFDEDWEKTWRH